MKTRRNFITKLTGVAALLTLTSARFSATGVARKTAAPLSGNVGGSFVHTVFFWLVDETLPTRGKFVTELMKFINNVEVIRTSHVGRPADTQREVVDNTYSYCLIATFDSKEDHDIYQAHPLHKQFIDNASLLWTKVLVYDSVRCSTNPTM